MEKSQKSHFVKLFLIALLFFFTPLLSPSMRPPYLYFLLNILIIALGAEAGFLSFLKPQDHDKKPSMVAPKNMDITARMTTTTSPQKDVADHEIINNDVPSVTTKKARKVEKSVSEKIVSVVKVNKLKKCPSTPSIFFIGGGEPEEEETKNGFEEEDEEGYLTKQELFTKAETFIGNFYHQLKIQREDSWRKIHGLYHKAF